MKGISGIADARAVAKGESSQMSTTSAEASLSEHCVETRGDTGYGFGVSRISATSGREELIAALGVLMERNKTDPQVTNDLLRTVGGAAAVAKFTGGLPAVRRGDFGEVLAAEAAEAFDDLKVPVRKLRTQIDPNQTLPGSDVVAFVMNDRTISELEFIESKYRANPDSDVGVKAHDQLAGDREADYATTLSFVAHRLKESEPDLYEAFMEFLADRSVKASRHKIALTVDVDGWREDVIVRLAGVPELLPGLWVRVFALVDCNGLVEEVYKGLVWRVIDDE